MVEAVDVGEGGALPAGITDRPAAAEVTEVEEGTMVAEAGVGAVTVVVVVPANNTVEGDTLAEEVDGGKSNTRCWHDQTSNPLHEIIPASSDKFLFSLNSRLFSTRLPGLIALLS